jgi:serine/threonine protein kinase
VVYNRWRGEHILGEGQAFMQAVESFLKSVLRSGLLDREQLQQALRGVPTDRRDDSGALAKHLVRSGLLSAFQASKLLRGTARGLRLGPYQIITPIGRGGMGTVYLARDSRNQEMLALKVLPPKKARAEERLINRFRREMELCQLVSHPHLAQSYGVGVCDGIYYIAMEYIPGKSLHRLVAEDGTLTVPRAARLFAEAGSALEYAHGQGLIHRDLKPSNILVTPNDHAKVVDLGLALMEGEDLTDREVVGGRGFVVGTTDYMAPEQVADAVSVDARSDIYGLGCTLYHVLTGQPPFPGGTRKEKIQRHRNEQPTPIPQLNPSVPPGFVGIVRKMMAKDPAQRYASAAELREELVRWAGSAPGLPLDEADGPAFQEAVVDLETAEPAADGADDLLECLPLPEDAVPEAIPVGTLVPPPRPRARPAPVVIPSVVRLPPPGPRDMGPTLLLILEVGALFLFAVGLAVVLWLMLR